MSNPIAVLISDVHYNVHTLSLADAGMRQAITKANELNIPLIVAGDLHDTKANMRAECVNAMIETFSLCKTPCYIPRGNHDQIHEKSTEHALNFLRTNNITIVDVPIWSPELNLNLIPYQSESKKMLELLQDITPKESIIIIHQGCQGSNMGDYVQDHSALPKECFADFRVISGHYHTKQDIVCGKPRKGQVGLFSYIGNPYTLGFGEANDPSKGFQILMDDGTLKFVPTNLRRHIILNVETMPNGTNYQITGKILLEDVRDIDLVWVKFRGTKEQLLTINKEKVTRILKLKDFRLDLIPLDTETELSGDSGKLPQTDTLDNLIDSMNNTSDERKARLKDLWRKTVCA